MNHAFFDLSRASLFALVIAFAPLSSAVAQETDVEAPLVQVQLTPEKVKNFVTAFQDIKTWQKTLEPAKTGHDAEEHDEVEETDALSVTQNPENTEKMKTILNKYGFSSLENWEQTAQTVMLAYGYADPQSGMADMKKNITDSIEQIKKDDTLPAAEKAEAIKNLNDEIAAAEKMKPLPANVDVVKPYVDDIKKMVESE